MARVLTRLGAVVGVIGVVWGLGCPALAQQQPCERIRMACQAAGFVQGGVKAGNGLVRDCVDPIVQGEPQPTKANRPLPEINPAVAAACRAARTSADAAAAAANTPAAALPPRPGHWPNIVLILVDDFSLDLMTQSMPNLSAMQKDGVTFTNYFVTDSLCCPSRSSIFTGKFPHNTLVFTNTPPFGGYDAFMAHDNVSHTFSLALHNAGYQTAMMGKYLNGYRPAKDGVPPGWSEWDVAGSKGYAEFGYALNQNGRVQRYGVDPASYLTDVLSGLGDAFIRKSAGGPFFLEIATFAPHAPYIPAPRDADKFPGLTYTRNAAFGARPNATAPGWLKEIPSLQPADIAVIDSSFRMRVQSDQSIDQMIGRIRAALTDLALEKDTFVIFTSDNGLHLGEYSLRPGKMTPFDTDIRVPLVIVGPGVAQGRTVDEIVENIDLAPTFTELAGESVPIVPDGRSLIPLLHLKPGAVASWRESALIEHRHPTKEPADPDIQEPVSGNPPSYEAVRTRDALYIEYDDTAHEVGYYDLTNDPFELNNLAPTAPAVKLSRFHEILSKEAACQGAEACWAAQSIKP